MIEEAHVSHVGTDHDDAIFIQASSPTESMKQSHTKKRVGVNRVRKEICRSSPLISFSFAWPAEVKCWTTTQHSVGQPFCSKSQYGHQEPLQLTCVVSDYCSSCWHKAAARSAGSPSATLCSMPGGCVAPWHQLLLFHHHCHCWRQLGTDVCSSWSSFCPTSCLASWLPGLWAYNDFRPSLPRLWRYLQPHKVESPSSISYPISIIVILFLC